VAARSQLLFESPLLAVGEFYCPPTSTLWNALNLIGETAHVVFPRTSVVIRHSGRPPLVTSRNHVVFYNAGEEYRRALHDRRGDHCVFVSLQPQFALDEPGAAFPFNAGPADSLTYLLQHVLVRELRRAVCDRLIVEETAADVVSRSIASAARFHERRTCTGSRRAARSRYELAQDAKSWLIESFAAPATLGEIARALHTSPFHLARVFRAETGFALHEYRSQLRLRAALDRVDAGVELLTVAHELGYSSHSHFTRFFTRAFGIPPSRLRARGDAGTLAELRATVDARLSSRVQAQTS
jgi:AraC family transcriptional regulator